MVIGSSFFTEALGSSALFGGFLVGVIVPHNHHFAIDLLEKLEDLINIFFLPLVCFSLIIVSFVLIFLFFIKYFVYVGFHTDLTLLSDGTSWGIIILLVLTGAFGKIVGAGTAAALTDKMNPTNSVLIGLVLNTKG